jgi:hypothetical protein
MTTITNTTSTGGCQDCGGSDLVSLERTRYFPRQLVGPADLTQDQVYFREKERRHNRLLHGWGIVCGALVTQGDGCKLKVSPGYVLGPYGDEILIDAPIELDVCKQDSIGVFDCGDVDVWCGDAPRIKDDATAYLAVRYAERATRPVRVPGCGCGCDGGECEYSRLRDGFELKVLTELPESYLRPKPMNLGSVLACTGNPARAKCPPCPSDPWVILCDFKVSGGSVSSIDCDAHRRYVASFAGYYFMCGGAELKYGEMANFFGAMNVSEGPGE